MTRARALPVLAPALLVAALGCEPATCPDDESFVVDEVGTCVHAPARFTLAAHACRISIEDSTGTTGLPDHGAMSQRPQPLRQGDFILFTDDPAPFRLCRAKRVEFRLELTCVDAQGAPVCSATLTEPSP